MVRETEMEETPMKFLFVLVALSGLVGCTGPDTDSGDSATQAAE